MSDDQGKKGKKSKIKKTKKGQEWKKVAPKSGGPTTIQKNGRTYHWCPNHQAWTYHKPEECKGKEFRKEESGNEKNDNEKKDDEKKDKGDGASKGKYTKFKSKLAELLCESDSDN